MSWLLPPDKGEDMAIIGGGGRSSVIIEACRKMDLNLKIGNLDFSLSSDMGFGPYVKTDFEKEAADRGYKLALFSLLSDGTVWVVLEKMPEKKYAGVFGNCSQCGEKLGVFDKKICVNCQIKKPEPKHALPPPPPPKKDDDLSWANELDKPIDPSLPEHLFDLQKVHPFKLWANKILYKLRGL